MRVRTHGLLTTALAIALINLGWLDEEPGQRLPFTLSAFLGILLFQGFAFIHHLKDHQRSLWWCTLAIIPCLGPLVILWGRKGEKRGWGKAVKREVGADLVGKEG